MMSLPMYKLRYAARKATLYVVAAGVAVVIIIPVYFLVATSFMSDFEAYTLWPQPVVPSFSVLFEIKETEDGYILSAYDSAGKRFVPLVESIDLADLTARARDRTNVHLPVSMIAGKVEGLPRGETLQFRARKSMLANFRLFFAVTVDATGALMRSISVSLMTVLLSLGLGGLAGYGFARYNFRGKHGLKLSMLFVRIFPAVSIAIPMVMILGRMGLYDRPIGLALVYAVGQIGLTAWITAGIFAGIPRHLEEAAMVFGASRAGAFWHVTLPLAMPGLAACAMYGFIEAWKETVQAILLTQMRPTFSVVVYQSLIGATGMVNITAAGGVIMALPAVIFTFLIRRYILRMWGGTAL